MFRLHLNEDFAESRALRRLEGQRNQRTHVVIGLQQKTARIDLQTQLILIDRVQQCRVLDRFGPHLGQQHAVCGHAAENLVVHVRDGGCNRVLVNIRRFRVFVVIFQDAGIDDRTHFDHLDVTFRRALDRVGVGVSGGRVQGVSLDTGDELSTPLVINAAGPWCERLSRAAGLELPWTLVPTRIQVMYRDRPDALEGHIPVTADLAGGIYFRTQSNGQQLVIGSVREEDEREAVADPDNFRTETDHDFEALNLHVLHHRLPGLPASGRVRGYCGLYTTNLEDVHPILGPTEIEGFWVANGFSGHGFKLAPAIGAMLAQAVTGERRDFDTDVALSFLAVDRKPINIAAKNVLA